MSPRRERTVSAVVLPVLALVAILTVTVMLQRTAPRADTMAMPVAIPAPDIPALPADHRGECRRHPDEVAVELLREEIVPGGRVSSGMVLACPEAFDGFEVVYVGEVVGDLLRRDGGAWVLVNDDTYALQSGPLPAHDEYGGKNTGLSVWLDDPLSDTLSDLGGPGRRGDVVRLEATVIRTDPRDGGGLTLRASSLDVLEPSAELTAPFHRAQAAAAAGVLLTAAAAAIGLSRSRRH